MDTDAASWAGNSDVAEASATMLVAAVDSGSPSVSLSPVPVSASAVSIGGSIGSVMVDEG
jgi:hypothetical protein